MSEEIKNKAYLIASRLKNSGYDNEGIRARLDKEGVPEELIKQVLMNLSIQQKADIAKQQEPFYNIALVKIGIGIFLAILSIVFVPGQIYLPVGLIGSGIAVAFFFKPDKK